MIGPIETDPCTANLRLTISVKRPSAVTRAEQRNRHLHKESDVNLLASESGRLKVNPKIRFQFRHGNRCQPMAKLAAK